MLDLTAASWPIDDARGLVAEVKWSQLSPCEGGRPGDRVRVDGTEYEVVAIHEGIRLDADPSAGEPSFLLQLRVAD